MRGIIDKRLTIEPVADRHGAHATGDKEGGVKTKNTDFPRRLPKDATMSALDDVEPIVSDVLSTSDLSGTLGIKDFTSITISDVLSTQEPIAVNFSAVQ